MRIVQSVPELQPGDVLQFAGWQPPLGGTYTMETVKRGPTHRLRKGDVVTILEVLGVDVYLLHDSQICLACSFEVEEVKWLLINEEDKEL